MQTDVSLHCCPRSVDGVLECRPRTKYVIFELIKKDKPQSIFEVDKTSNVKSQSPI